MVAVNSTMLPIGTVAPDFELQDTLSNKNVSLKDFPNSQGYWVMFICNHCPYVKHIQGKIAEIAKAYQSKGITTIAISSNDVENYPQDAPDKMTEEAKSAGYTFPYLYDADQSVAKAYRAACTPDFFIFDKDLKLTYRGQFDSSRPGNDIPVTGANICKALDLLLSGKTMPEAEQTPSVGCNIKWKPGNEPDYF